MAYKRYVKRGRKLYGPYIYESKRVGDKVVTHYIGQERHVLNKLKKQKIKTSFNKKYLLIIPLIILVIGAVVLFYFFKPFSLAPSGKIALQISDSWVPNQFLTGQLSQNLKSGELIPGDTIVRLSLGGQEAEISLAEIELINKKIRKGENEGTENEYVS